MRRDKFIGPEWVSRRFAKIPHPGIYRPIPVLPTGTGKMLIGAEGIRRHLETASSDAVNPALFIAHREELLHQAQRTSESSPGPKDQSSLRSICPRFEGDNSFTVVFYGLTIFACKTAQFCVTLRESEMAETPSVSNATQPGENTGKNSFLNYKSAALPTELCRRCPCESRFSELIKTSSDDRAASRNIRYSPDEISSLLTLRAHAHAETCAMVFVGCCLLRLSVATVL